MSQPLVEPTDQPPTPPPTPPAAPPAPPSPPVPAPPPAPAPPAAPPVNPPQPGTGVGEHGYPESTPLSEMTTEQREAYWRHQSRKHEQRAKSMSDYEQLKAAAAELEQLRAQNMTDQEKAVSEAVKRGRAEALQEAGSRLVEQFFRAALHNRLDDERLSALLGPLDRKQFLTADGLGVDTDKVSAFAALVAPPVTTQSAVTPATPAPVPVAPATGAPAPRPDMGQGNPVAPKAGGLDRGREIARQRFGQPKQPAQQPQ